MILAPRWNWHSRCILGISFAFWLIFTFVALVVSWIVVNQLMNGIARDGIAGALLVLCMAIGSLFWASEMARLRGVRYDTHSSASFLIWRELPPSKDREVRINLSSIERIEPVGSPKIGYYLKVVTSSETHRLGTFLSMNDIYQIERLIEKGRAEPGSGADGGEAAVSR